MPPFILLSARFVEILFGGLVTFHYEHTSLLFTFSFVCSVYLSHHWLVWNPSLLVLLHTAYLILIFKAIIICNNN